MTSRIMGLVGPGKGPWVHTHHLHDMRVRVLGLKSGVVKLIFIDDEMEISKTGTYKLEKDQPMIRVEYDGEDQGMICTFLSGGPVAIH